MSADFPTINMTPRAIENVAGVVYNASDKKTLFAEDIRKIEDEIVAIEKALLNIDDKKIPFGTKFGDDVTNLEITDVTLQSVKYPALKPVVSGGSGLQNIVLPRLVSFDYSGGLPQGFAFINSAGQIVSFMTYNPALNSLQLFRPFTCTGAIRSDDKFNCNGSDGWSGGLTYMVDTRMNAGVLQKRTAVLNFAGGICTGNTGLTGWVNA